MPLFSSSGFANYTAKKSTIVFTITPSATSVNEGSSINFQIASENIPDGKTFYWSTTSTLALSTGSGYLIPQSFTDSVTSGSVTINSNLATITRGIVANNIITGQNKFRIQLRTGSVSGRIIKTSNEVTINDRSQSLGPTGQIQYTVSGTYTFVVPAGVTSISVACVGAGGGGYVSSETPVVAGGGGGGGSLSYVNDIPVTPGASYTVVVGKGGSKGETYIGILSQDGKNGERSYFADPDTGVVASGGFGGSRTTGGIGGAYVGAGNDGSNGQLGGAGGGAGGYDNSSGGGNGGVATYSGIGLITYGGKGGGVYLYGQYSKGDDGSSGINYGGNGTAGSLFAPFATDPYGGAGGGGAGAHFDPDIGLENGLSWGQDGAIRIVWPGNYRQFPGTALIDF